MLRLVTLTRDLRPQISFKKKRNNKQLNTFNFCYALSEESNANIIYQPRFREKS